ncbi:MAG: hypothetical protein ACI4J7_01690 [Ruminiclostridium sp.]
MNTSFSPNEERFGFHTSGNFRCAYPFERTAAIIITAIAILLFIIFFGVFMKESRNNPTGGIFYILRCGMFLFIPTGFVYLAAINILFRGQEYRYTADEKNFTIFCPNGTVGNKTIYINYSDVAAVTYENNTLFGIERGYKVTIVTKKGTYCFNYCIERRTKLRGTDTTPFHIIEERSSGTKPEFYV